MPDDSDCGSELLPVELMPDGEVEDLARRLANAREIQLARLERRAPVLAAAPKVFTEEELTEREHCANTAAKILAFELDPIHFFDLKAR